MEATASTQVLLEDHARRERAKERFYVLCQVFGWGSFLAVQVFYTLVLARGEDARDPATTIAVCTMVMAEGLLITHYSRPLIERWGWKQLGWRLLGPRLLGLAAAQSAVWTIMGYSYTFALCRIFHFPFPSRYGPVVVLTVSWIQGISLLTGWLCIYFFYHLFDRFNRSEIERLRLAGTAKESELRALKSQVNPHFIFNSLNSLRALIEEDPLRARQAVTQLANLLRYSLQSGQQETVPFEDELSVVNDYLALEQVRHEERLRLRLDVAPDTLQLPIPPMLLQTLVENAVKYGISARPEGGEIAIIARRENDSLRLQVTNPGALESGSERVARANGSTGMGLANAANRLRLLFGERATLRLRAGEPGSVVAEAIIPLPVSHA